jgi:hypothetical protein
MPYAPILKTRDFDRIMHVDQSSTEAQNCHFSVCYHQDEISDLLKSVLNSKLGFLGLFQPTASNFCSIEYHSDF